MIAELSLLDFTMLISVHVLYLSDRENKLQEYMSLLTECMSADLHFWEGLGFGVLC